MVWGHIQKTVYLSLKIKIIETNKNCYIFTQNVMLQSNSISLKQMWLIVAFTAHLAEQILKQTNTVAHTL